ncbi:anti-sigma factor [Melioribacteraceae bacterium 4301-Me]|uniref:anti-sigma factor n=1 Tax=Pyranulibacter aquaticus TaxID=3163344 RepID=UPI003597FEA5
MSDPISEMSAAFAVGCMDKENFIQFKDYLLSGGELPKGLLGEFQNIVAMIPAILDLEVPDSSLKDDVAKKLIGLKEEIKTKIREEKKRTATIVDKPKTLPTKQTLTRVTAAEEKQPRKLSTFISENRNLPKSVAEGSNRKTNLEQRDSLLTEEKRATTIKEKTRIDDVPPTLFPQRIGTVERRSLEQEKTSGFAGWLAIFLALILFGVIGYYSYTSINDLQQQVSDLKNELVKTKNDLQSTSEFTSKYMTVIEFLNYKGIFTVDLTSTQPNVNSSAKLFVAPYQREALLQLNNIPPLKLDQTYQIWMVSKDKFYSLATFSPRPEDMFIKISNLPYIPFDQIDLFRITIEPAGGSPAPTGETYLYGSLNNVSSKTRK